MLHGGCGDGSKQASGSLMGRTPDSVCFTTPPAGGRRQSRRPLQSVIANHIQGDDPRDHVVHYNAGMSIQKSETAELVPSPSRPSESSDTLLREGF